MNDYRKAQGAGSWSDAAIKRHNEMQRQYAGMVRQFNKERRV
tara:strand:- start:803 stop:928 length:126 start_codon:yes stop_codon:yes gene_type:complete